MERCKPDVEMFNVRCCGWRLVLAYLRGNQKNSDLDSKGMNTPQA